MAEVITWLLDRIYEAPEQEKETKKDENILPQPITENAYENSVRYQNHNSKPELAGFEADMTPCTNILENFRKGFTAWKENDRITFKVTGTGIAVQYRKSVHKPTPIARAVVDGKEDEAVLLDGNFEEDWGDCLYVDTVAEHMPLGEHTIEITIIEAHEKDVVPFYLVSVIGSK